MQFLKTCKKLFYLKILKRRYYRLGSCAKCGACCENIYVRHKQNIIKTQSEFEKVKENDPYSFYRHIEITGKDNMGLIFKCSKFDKEKRICTNHKNRPSICRNYPSEEIFQMGAQLCDKCGYKFEPIENFAEVYKKVLKKSVKSFDAPDD